MEKSLPSFSNIPLIMHSILLQHYFNALTKININCILRQNICLQEQKLEDTKNGLKRGRFLVSWNTVLTTSYSSFRNCFIKIFLWKKTVLSSFYRLHTEVKELLSKYPFFGGWEGRRVMRGLELDFRLVFTHSKPQSSHWFQVQASKMFSRTLTLITGFFWWCSL